MNRTSYRAQSGVAFLLFITVMVLTGTLFTVGKLSINQKNNERSSSSFKKLQTAQDAVLGYALSQPIPGVLPCPDISGNGDADNTASGCAQQKGWLPFRTLGLEDLRDQSGEKLWYVIDPEYSLATAPFNSSTISRLNQEGNPLAFAILAPNDVLANQQRSANIANANNYLEGVNSDADPFTVAYQNDSDHNDQLLVYSTKKFWTLIESSTVIPAASTALNQYFTDCGSYPWAASFAVSPLNSVVGLQQGSLASDSPLASDGSGCASTLSLPAWLTDHWALEIQYQFCLNTEGQCLSISGDESTTATAALLAAGTSLAGQDRTTKTLGNYFENENSSTSTIIEIRNPQNHSVSFNDVATYLP